MLGTFEGINITPRIQNSLSKVGRCYHHIKTWKKPRVNDGQKHPVKIIRPAKKRAN